MIELYVYNYLKDKNFAVYMEWELNMYGDIVIVEKTSGSQSNHLKSATFAFQSYGDSLYEAAKLNEKVKEAIFAMEELPLIAGVHLNSDYNYTDTQIKRYRYQAVFDINYY